MKIAVGILAFGIRNNNNDNNNNNDYNNKKPCILVKKLIDTFKSIAKP